MDRRSKVELFEQIRREYEFGSGSIRSVAKKLGVHRRLVRQAIESALPPERTYTPRPAPRLDPLKPFIDLILKADLQAPRKQRHTTQRIYKRIRQELPQHPIGRSTVGEYVLTRKQELGLLRRETFVPQSYEWGGEGQVDWYEAFADGWASGRECMYSACAAWPAAARSTMRTSDRHSRPFWKHMS